ncbi:MAG: SUMF1/EgtB/PvdO family nonheme iron enzyme [Deltaproteobacteria bacterium]|nr:SUMF1/EgtB/PvdO family nonheme iron enzyme [Deltaproteobacteria bacterium]
MRTLILLVAAWAAEPAAPPVESPPPVPPWTGSSGYTMIHVATGSFVMGSPENEAGRNTDERRHDVRITRSFWLGQREVTQDLWIAVMGTTPFVKDYKGVPLVGSRLPAQSVSWFDAIRFCNALSARDGLEPAYVVNGDEVSWSSSARGYRLPTEAEWEYAARAGTDRAYTGARGSGGLCSVANVADATARRKWPMWTGAVPCNDGFLGPAPVGSLQPNPWGLFDMSGNVSEWVWDRYGPYADGPVDDPSGATTGSLHLARGGSWADNGTFNRVAHRKRHPPDFTDAFTGLRLARSE